MKKRFNIIKSAAVIAMIAITGVMLFKTIAENKMFTGLETE